MKKELLITGAANGIGKATALKFAENGWHVWATDMDERGLGSFHGAPDIEPVVMDVTSASSVQKVFEIICARQSGLDLVINNAGIDRYFPFCEAPVEQFTEVFEVNVFGAYRVNQVFLPLLKKPGGRIIHIGSESLNLEIPFMPYPLSKKALESYSKVLRQELRFMGIRVVVVRPGAVRTNILENVAKIRYPVGNKQLGLAFDEFASRAPGEVGRVESTGTLAALLLRIAEIPRPRAVYRINNSLQLKIAALIPFAWLEKMVYRKLSK